MSSGREGVLDAFRAQQETSPLDEGAPHNSAHSAASSTSTLSNTSHSAKHGTPHRTIERLVSKHADRIDKARRDIELLPADLELFSGGVSLALKRTPTSSLHLLGLVRCSIETEEEILELFLCDLRLVYPSLIETRNTCH